jgi:hypothetical protein
VITTTQQAHIENVLRSIKYVKCELKLRPEDSNMIDLVNHLETNIDVLIFSLKIIDLETKANERNDKNAFTKASSSYPWPSIF